jgi:hypothetical protein
LYADYDSECKLDYLLFPLLARLGWDIGESPFRFYVAAGPFAGFLIQAQQVTSGTSMIYVDSGKTMPLGSQSFNATTNIRSQMNIFNVGVIGFMGISFRFGANTFFIEGGGNFGFLPAQKSKADGQDYIGAAIISIGYSYTFGM